jgi:ATP-binding cassette subfamily C exporter for protease/lipase
MWSHRQQHSRQLNTDVHHLTHRLLAISKFIRYSQQSLALGAGALLVIDGQLSPGAMIAANILMTRALSPIDMVVSGWRQFAGMKFSFLRLENMLREFPRLSHPDKGLTPRGQVTAVSLSADVPGSEQRILKEVHFDVPAGSSVAILGPSGSGKSTLARVLVGIWPSVSGQLLLDGTDLQSWNRSELGSHIGYLPQDIELFEGSISENIARFGAVDPAQVIEAAKNAGLHDMILKYPNGYDTLIGDAGNLLSGGQRQRVALARALYANPALVVLDEPDANLDAVGEAALTQAISRLKTAGKTVFFITHRSAAVTQADYLILLRQGVVYAAGPREEVLSRLRNQSTSTAQNPLARGVAEPVAAD